MASTNGSGGMRIKSAVLFKCIDGGSNVFL